MGESLKNITRDSADEMIRKIKDNNPNGSKRRFLLMQVLTALHKKLKGGASATKAVNGLILKHDLDLSDNIKLFKV